MKKRSGIDMTEEESKAYNEMTRAMEAASEVKKIRDDQQRSNLVYEDARERNEQD